MQQIRVNEPDDDLISGEARSLATKIDIPSDSARGDPFISSDGYKIKAKCLLEHESETMAANDW
jgi:hypothetical protein